MDIIATVKIFIGGFYMYAIETCSLCKEYKGFKAVDNLNLKVNYGEIYGFLGNNGAGKTTTIAMLVGLNKPTKGKVNILGTNIKNKNGSVLKKVGSIIDTPGYYGNLTVYENMDIFKKLYGSTKKNIIEELLSLGGLLTERNKLAKNLSKGMKQRLGIIRTLINEPELLILDEPINGLDPNSIKEMRELFIKLSKEKKLTILISSHILSEIENVADRIGILHEGKILDEIEMKDLRHIDNKYIELEVDNIYEAVRIIEEELNIHSYEVKKDEIIIFEKIQQASLINKTLVYSNLNVNKLVVRSKNLESYFLNITKEGENHV
jgi:bacitracin transport system ATP-binding protein